MLCIQSITTSTHKKKRLPMRKRKDDHQSKSPRNEKDDRTGQGIKIVIFHVFKNTNIFHVFKNTKKYKHDESFRNTLKKGNQTPRYKKYNFMKSMLDVIKSRYCRRLGNLRTSQNKRDGKKG